MSDEKQEQYVPELTREPVYRHWSYDQLYDEHLRLEAECQRLSTELHHAWNDATATQRLVEAVTAERDRLATELRCARAELGASHRGRPPYFEMTNLENENVGLEMRLTETAAKLEKLGADYRRLETELRVEREEHQHTRDDLSARLDASVKEREKLAKKVEFFRRQVDTEEAEGNRWHDLYVSGTERISELKAEVERWRNIAEGRQAAECEVERLRGESTEMRAQLGEISNMFRNTDPHASFKSLPSAVAEAVFELMALRKENADPPSTIRLAHEQRDRALAEARDATARLRDAVVLTREERDAIDGVLREANISPGANITRESFLDAIDYWVACGRPLLGGGEEPGE